MQHQTYPGDRGRGKMRGRKSFKALLAAAGVALAVSLPASAAARPVAPRTAHGAIMRWWRDTSPPRVLWCAEKHYGTICGIRTGLDTSGPFAADVHGYENAWLWVSRKAGRTSVAFLDATLTVTIEPTALER